VHTFATSHLPLTLSVVPSLSASSLNTKATAAEESLPSQHGIILRRWHLIPSPSNHLPAPHFLVDSPIRSPSTRRADVTLLSLLHPTILPYVRRRACVLYSAINYRNRYPAVSSFAGSRLSTRRRVALRVTRLRYSPEPVSNMFLIISRSPPLEATPATSTPCTPSKCPSQRVCAGGAKVPAREIGRAPDSCTCHCTATPGQKETSEDIVVSIG